MIVVSGNAREKTSVQHLMENILLFTDFKTNPDCPAQGVVVDNYLHPQTGSRVVELLVQDGKLKEKDTIFLNGKFGKVKMMFDIQGRKVAAVCPSDVAQIIGLNVQAELGDRFLVVNEEKLIAAIENEVVDY
jgi:translation initiation factor IF-2